MPFQMLSFLFHFFLLSVFKRRSFLSGSNMEKGWDDPIPGSQHKYQVTAFLMTLLGCPALTATGDQQHQTSPDHVHVPVA